MTKEHPVLFSGPMVNAILGGRKTQTRRVIKPPLKHPNWTYFTYFKESGHAIEDGPDYPDNKEDERRCPYGQPGDRLWVREAWRPDDFDSSNVIYRADMPQDALDEARGIIKWKPSIHMPRWASRITLEISKVRVERLQEITEEDAIAEGIIFKQVMGDAGLLHGYFPGNCKEAMTSFGVLWNEINSKRGYGWDKNPWVWVVEFRRVNEGGKWFHAAETVIWPILGIAIRLAALIDPLRLDRAGV